MVIHEIRAPRKTFGDAVQLNDVVEDNEQQRPDGGAEAQHDERRHEASRKVRSQASRHKQRRTPGGYGDKKGDERSLAHLVSSGGGIEPR